MCLAWLWSGKEGYEKFEARRRNDPSEDLDVEDLYPNSWFYTVHPDTRNAGEETSIVESEKLYVRLKTSEPHEAVVIQLNRGVVDYFEEIEKGNDELRERAFIWEAFSIVERHCLAPNPKMRSIIGEVHDLLSDLVERYARG